MSTALFMQGIKVSGTHIRLTRPDADFLTFSQHDNIFKKSITQQNFAWSVNCVHMLRMYASTEGEGAEYIKQIMNVVSWLGHRGRWRLLLNNTKLTDSGGCAVGARPWRSPKLSGLVRGQYLDGWPLSRVLAGALNRWAEGWTVRSR